MSRNTYISRVNRLHYTYAIATKGLIKVGFTTHLNKRIKWYKTNVKDFEVLMLKESSIASLDEKTLIKGMKDLVKGKEWFKDTEENREFIKNYKLS